MNLLGLLVRDVAFQHAYLFACPIDVRYDGPCVGIQLPIADHFYWALDPMGTTRLSQDECDSLGIPRLRFNFLPSANFWHEYHYSAIRNYCRTKGLDPYTYDVTRGPELPLIELNH
ncbi:hypothetical protein FB451DRAFT_1277565 [Mycena latifolia]|nr:hypothetical protein FB451DRAFT_1277565 [Mycena latifolia]